MQKTAAFTLHSLFAVVACDLLASLARRCCNSISFVHLKEKKNQKDRNNNNKRPVAGMIDIRSGKLLEISFRWLVEGEKVIDNM